MRPFAAWLAVSLLAAQSKPDSQSQPLSPAEIARRVSPSVVTIRGVTPSGEVLGSGFVISSTGMIVTNLHVIRDLKTVMGLH
jgi:S1-C subfamily serine protease